MVEFHLKIVLDHDIQFPRGLPNDQTIQIVCQKHHLQNACDMLAV